jgi:hypothetical protein
VLKQPDLPVLKQPDLPVLKQPDLHREIKLDKIQIVGNTGLLCEDHGEYSLGSR